MMLIPFDAIEVLLMSATEKSVANPVSLSKGECSTIARSLALYEKSIMRAANNPDQLPGAVAEFRKSVSEISALRARFVGLM